MLLYVSYRVISFLTAVGSLPRDSRANWNELKSFSSQVSNTNKALLLSTGTINSIMHNEKDQSSPQLSHPL